MPLVSLFYHLVLIFMFSCSRKRFDYARAILCHLSTFSFRRFGIWCLWCSLAVGRDLTTSLVYWHLNAFGFHRFDIWPFFSCFLAVGKWIQFNYACVLPAFKCILFFLFWHVALIFIFFCNRRMDFNMPVVLAIKRSLFLLLTFGAYFHVLLQ